MTDRSPEITATLVIPGRRPVAGWQRVARRLWQLRTATLSGVFLVGLVLMAVFADFIAPYNPYEGELVDRLKPPVWEHDGSWAHILGTDQVGRDNLSRLIFGARVSLAAGFLATVVAAAIGVALGLVAGYVGRLADTVISTLINIQLTVPFILLALLFIGAVGPGLVIAGYVAVNVIIVLGIASWPIYARVIRAEVLKLRELDFVTAARCLGISDARILLRHILPNTFNSVIVLSTVQVARFIITEAFLSFLGLGTPPPTPTWGSMLADARQFMFDKWWLPTFPGLAIFMTTLAINLFGDGLRDWLDPYSRNV
jgi:peptide/nickel transport system permease protein